MLYEKKRGIKNMLYELYSLYLKKTVLPSPEVITFFILNSAEHEIYPAPKCYNANNCWHFNIN